LRVADWVCVAPFDGATPCSVGTGRMPGVSEIVVLRSEAETEAAGRQMGSTIGGGTTVLLYGDLGAGKTAFVRGLADGLGIDRAQVSSPTFTIVQEYRGGRLTLQHVDLYRLSSPEIHDLALEDLAGPDTVMAVEWAERLPEVPPGALVELRLAHAGDSRTLELLNPSA
jgi:tRNA threonylcarbamoyladenosine biosynthesis protein TsaE